MMDIALVQDPDTGDFDWGLNATGTDLASDSSLYTPVMLSLGTNRLANADDVIPDGTGDRRGSWMDIPLANAAGETAAPTDLMGSRLWLLSRAKATQQTLLLAVSYVEEALVWLTEDGIAQAVTVTAQYRSTTGLGQEILDISIIIARQVAGQPLNETYTALWSATAGLISLSMT